MTKRIFAGAFALLAGFGIASQAHASDRVPFTTDILHRVQNVESGIDNVRVYLNHRLVVRRSIPVGSSTTSVDGTVDTVIHGQERKDVVRRISSGKIVGVGTSGSLTQLWVSFDSDCNTRDCAWQFVNGFGDEFGLAALPVRDAQGLQVDAMWIGRKPFWWANMETWPEEVYQGWVFNTRAAYAELKLQVKLNELIEVEHKTVRHDGWGN